MKKILCAVLAILVLSGLCPTNCYAVCVSAQSAIAIDGNAGLTVFEKNAFERRGMASTTKIMTAIVAIENCPLEKTVNIASEAVGIEGSSVYLEPGEQLSMKHLLYALLLQSANDAAAAIAIEVGGSIEGFAELMNMKAAELGLTDTHFTNPHGLFDEDHFTTAYDLAQITKYALKNATFKEIVSTVRTVIPLHNGEGSRVLLNHNKLLKTYEGAVGVKTGFTKKTGRCLVSAAERDGTLIIAVTLNDPCDWYDHSVLLDLGFEKISTLSLVSPGEINIRATVVGGEKNYIRVTNQKGLTCTVAKDDLRIRSEYILDRFYFAPLSKGDVVGKVIYYNGDEELGRVDLVAAEESPAKKHQRKKLFGLF